MTKTGKTLLLVETKCVYIRTLPIAYREAAGRDLQLQPAPDGSAMLALDKVSRTAPFALWAILQNAERRKLFGEKRGHPFLSQTIHHLRTFKDWSWFKHSGL